MSKPSEATTRLVFEAGTLRLEGLPQGAEVPSGCLWDERAGAFRVMALDYARVVMWLRKRGMAYQDDARAYADMQPVSVVRQKPFYYQAEALAAWDKARGRGVVVLPTGSGKTFTAVMAIDRRPRSTLVVVPTIDLLNQWYDLLQGAFTRRIGIVGGGYYEPEDITVITYDSAYLHMERLGNRFGLVVFDECHHLPSESYALAARCCLAPFRLGLTATPERNDGADALYDELIGPIIYRKDIDELSGSYLADYETQRIEVALSDAEREEYDQQRQIYLSFVRANRINFGSPGGWNEFIFRASRSEAGRRAFAAYRRQRQLALAATGKLAVLEQLLHSHRRDRAIVFTEDNATVYRISERFLVPAITHQTNVRERSAILKAFNAGELSVVVTSKVLNEGVDVPEANVAVVLSGNASVREHVQRLGRILRKRQGKRAVLYELVAVDTAEEGVSARRREHRAYN